MLNATPVSARFVLVSCLALQAAKRPLHIERPGYLVRLIGKKVVEASYELSAGADCLTMLTSNLTHLGIAMSYWQLRHDWWNKLRIA